MTVRHVRPILCLALALSIDTSAHAGTVMNTIRGKAVECSRLLARPFSKYNWHKPATLRTGERVRARALVEASKAFVWNLLMNDTAALQDLVDRAHDPKIVIAPTSEELFRRLRIFDSAGFAFPEYAASVRAIARRTGQGNGFVLSAPLPLTSLSDADMRRYLDRIDNDVVGAIVDHARELGLDVTASTEPPDLDAPRLPPDGTLLVDLGDDFAPITLLTPFGRLRVTSGSRLGDDEAWTKLKNAVRENMVLTFVKPSENATTEHSRLYTATCDFRRHPFEFPDLVFATGNESTKKLQDRWNALRPDRREEFK